MAISQLLRVPAPAKLNLFLHIVGRRADGYHLLQSVFSFVDLCDYLDFTVCQHGAIELVGEPIQGLAAKDNLIIRAARLLQQYTNTSLGVRITCEKNIPAGAGLGGGSSNAATTLIALNRLWQTGLTRQQLMALGLQLGADVPVFIFGRSAFAEGIGEQLQAVHVPNYAYLLIKPSTSVATASIFKDEALTRNSKPVIITDFTGYRAYTEPSGSVALFGTNVLEPVACKHAIEITYLLETLRNNNLHARMTGSGSCVFIAFFDKALAARQYNQLCSILLHEQPTVQIPLSYWVVNGLNIHPLYYWLTEFGD